MVRVLRPWFDSGSLHTLFGIESADALERHPKVGASFEGFALQQICAALGVRSDETFYWATHQGAELDLLLVRGARNMASNSSERAPPR